MSVLRAREQQRVHTGGEIPDDVGLFPDTFIMPFGRNRPSWLRDFKPRLRLEKRRLWRRIVDLAPLVAYRVLYVRPRPRLHIRSATAVAKKMHKDMYTAFAAGDLRPVESKICSGLLASLRSRIGQRPQHTHLKWTLHEYLSQPRLVSYRAGLLPGPDGQRNKDAEAQHGFTQAVIRIHSLQSLQHVHTTTVRDRGRWVQKETLVDAQGRELATEDGAGTVAKPIAKETVEYFVIQKQLRKSKEGDWMVWGTAEETTSAKVERGQRMEKEAKQRQKAMAGSA